MATFADVPFPLQNSTVITSDDVKTKTSIKCTSYADRHMVIISQLSKFGTWIYAWSESSMDGNKIFHTQTVLGKRDDPLLSVYARQIIEKIALVSDKPLMLVIALTEDGRDTKTFQQILNKLYEINTWQ